MAKETVTRSQRFYCVSLIPDICKTPIGPATPPIPYSVMGEFAEATEVSPNVKSRSEPVVLHQRSTIATVKGDEPGSAGGIKSGTCGKCVETKTASATLRANGTPTVQEGCEVWMNKRNTVGKIYERGGAMPRTRLQQIDAWMGEQAASATKSARDKLKPYALDYKNNMSARLHEFAGEKLDQGGDIALAGAALGLAGGLVSVSGVGVIAGAPMVALATQTEVTAARMMTAGSAAETSATILDNAAEFVLTGKIPSVAQMAKDIGVNIIGGIFFRKPNRVSQFLAEKFPILEKFLKKKPSKKLDKPPPAAPPDKPAGGKTKGDKKAPKSDKPSGCCPRNAAPGGKPVYGNKPIHFGTGEEVLYQTDFVLDGAQPIAWTRCYRSGSEHEDWGLLGARWSLPFTASLLLAARGIVYVDDSGRALCLPLLAIGQSLDNRKEGFGLARTAADAFTLTWRDGGTDTFVLENGGRQSWLPHGLDGVNAMRSAGRAERVHRFNLSRSAGRDGRGISVERHHDAAPGGLLLRVRGDDGGLLEAMRIGMPADAPADVPRIGQVDEVRGDGSRICRVRYRYEAESAESDSGAAEDVARLPRRFNLASQTNIAGASRHYAYRHHLLLSCSNYSGFRSTLDWISLAALRERWAGSALDGDTLRAHFPVTLDNSYQARATGSAGEDGSDALRIDYRDEDTSRVTDGVGGVLDYTFDANWLAVEVRRIKPDGGALSLGRRDWDRDGLLLAEIDAAGHATTYTYDAAGNVTGSTDALGRSSTMVYDAHNQPATLTDALGHTTRLVHDAAGRLIAHTDALGHTSTYRYDERGRLAEMRDARGGSKRFEYDDAGRLSAYTDCSGSRSEYHYDADGRVSAAIDAVGNTNRYEYDLLGRLRCAIRSDGTRDTYAFDADDNLLAHTDALGHVTAYRYDGRGLPVGRVDALGQALRYRYDAALRLVELVNGNGERYRLDYDADGALVAETGFDGKTTHYRYDRAGQLNSSACRGQRVDLVRDVCGQLVGRQTADGITRYAYDAAGRLVAVAAPSAEQRYAYDALGQLIEERSAYYLAPAAAVAANAGMRAPDASFIMTHAYDALGNRIQTVLPNGRRIDIERYGAGHWHGTLWQGGQVAAVERDGLHRETLRRLGAAATPLLVTRGYDPQSRLASITLRRDDDARTRLLSERRFRYDAAGNLLAIEQGGSAGAPGVIRYAYDPVGQLLSAVQPGLAETFAFDPAGNLLDPGVPAGTRAHAELPVVTHNLLRSYLGRDYRHDEQGNVVGKRFARGGDGARVDALDLEYDADNRLVHALRTTDTRRYRSRYFYDAYSRRIAKRVRAERWRDGRWQANASIEHSEHTTVFVWDGDTMVQELGGGKTITYLYEPESFVPLARVESSGGCELDAPALVAEGSDNGTARVGYLWHVAQWDLPGRRGKGAKPDARIQAEDAAAWNQRLIDAEAAALGDRISYFNCDHLGTPRELFDGTGSVLWSGRFRAWGGPYSDYAVAGDVAKNEQPLRFQGQYEDRETGLHYNRYRYYDPDCGRFVSQDPVGLLGGPNTYSYAPSPISWIDPLGLAKGKGGCDPCCGKNPAAEATAFQGKGAYPGIDTYINMVVKKGTIFYSLIPGRAPGFAVTNHTVIKAKGDPKTYHDLTQVQSDHLPPGYSMRDQVRVYRVTEDLCVAKGKAQNNPQFGSGGATQYYISEIDVGKLKRGIDRKI